MDKKPVSLFFLFLVLYIILHLAYLIPDLIHTRYSLYHSFDRNDETGSVSLDIIISFLFALIPYLILIRLYPKYNFSSFILSLITLPVIFILSYFIEVNWHTTRLKTFFLSHLFYDLIYVAFGIAVYFIRYSHYQEIQQKEALMQRKQAELSFLRSQINPHFLFNSLNNIYALVYKKSDQSLQALSSLSDLLRYMLYDTDEKVILQKELDYIEKYIALQKLRFEQNINVIVKIEGDTRSVLLPPLLLIPFVENAFKHGDFSVNGDGIAISVIIEKTGMLFHCTNKTGSHQKDPGGGIGLKNVRRRLELLYPGKHTLLINEKDNYFNIQLQVNHD